MLINNKKILKQLFFLLKNSVLGSFASYLLSIYLVNEFGPELFGEYSYILLIGMITSTLIVFSTDKTAVVLLQKNSSKNEAFNAILSLRIFLFLIITVGLLFLAIISREYVFYFSVFVISSLSLNLSFSYEMKKDNVHYSYVYLAERLVYVGLTFLAIYFKYLSLLNIFILLFIVSTCSLIYQIYSNKNLVANFSLVKIDVIVDILKNNIFLVVVTFSTFIYGGFSRIILKDKLGVYELGIYSAGWQIIMAITIYQAQIDRMWRVDFAKSLSDSDLPSFVLNLKTFFSYTLPPIIFLASALLFFRNELVHFIFNEEYIQVIELIPLYSIYFIVISLNSLSVMLWTSIGNRFQYLKINVVTSVILIIILLLSPTYIGVVGYTAIVVVFHLLSILLQLHIFYKHYIIKMKSGEVTC